MKLDWSEKKSTIKPIFESPSTLLFANCQPLKGVGDGENLTFFVNTHSGKKGGFSAVPNVCFHLRTLCKKLAKEICVETAPFGGASMKTFRKKGPFLHIFTIAFKKGHFFCQGPQNMPAFANYKNIKFSLKKKCRRRERWMKMHQKWWICPLQSFCTPRFRKLFSANKQLQFL